MSPLGLAPSIDERACLVVISDMAKHNSYICGPGGRFNTMPDERVEIPDYLGVIRIYMLTMPDICEVAR
jgi:hypothetical protein